MCRLVCLAAALALLAGGAVMGADFILTGTDHLDVERDYGTGQLWHSSTADMLLGGYIASACVYDQACLRVGHIQPRSSATITTSIVEPDAIWLYGGSLGHNTFAIQFGVEDQIRFDLATGQGYSMNQIVASINSQAGYGAAQVISSAQTGLSTLMVYAEHGGPWPVDMSWATQDGVMSRDFNTEAGHPGGGHVDCLTVCDVAHADIEDGFVGQLQAMGESRIDISGGVIYQLQAEDSCRVNLLGGHVDELVAQGGLVVLEGTDFVAGDGLVLIGREVLGTGTLGGKWLDGTPWSLDITEHQAGAVILAVPEPTIAAVLMAGWGALLGRRRGGNGAPPARQAQRL
jgi:hypothetical protein